ncbi:hypothetical protein ACXZ65_13815 [Streptomyces aculeolatus]
MTEVAGALLVALGVLLPSAARWVDSIAEGNRARGRAELIRARSQRNGGAAELQTRRDGA